jgi:hypothetical protein
MPDPRTFAESLSEKCRAMFGDELRSVMLFGSVARNEAIPGVSDVNILVLLDKVTPVELAKAAPLAGQWVRAGNTPPLVFSWEEWTQMGDTFAIEISDMLDAREVLFGSDPLTEDPLDRYDLRLHAEREIRQTMLQLRLRMLLSAGDPVELGHLLLSGIPSFGSYMRAALRLSGNKPASDTESVIGAAAELIGANPDAMLRCQAARRGRQVPDVSILDPLVDGYTEFAHELARFLDALPPEGPQAGGSAYATRTLTEGAR